jgi:hypothetical protein
MLAVGRACVVSAGRALLRCQTCAARRAPRAKCCGVGSRGPPRLTACGAADSEWGELERGLFIGEGDDLGPGWGQLGLAEPPNAGGEGASQPLEGDRMAAARPGPSAPAADAYSLCGGHAAAGALDASALASARCPAAPVSSDVVIIIDD